MAIKRIEGAELPCSITIIKGAPRSIDQNRLQHMWMRELESQGDMTASEYRAYCKLHFGVPLLRQGNEAFKLQYDAVVRPLPYEQKIEIMKEPIDFPCSRLMSVRQHAKFLDIIYEYWTAKGFQLTEPENEKSL